MGAYLIAHAAQTADTVYTDRHADMLTPAVVLCTLVTACLRFAVIDCQGQRLLFQLFYDDGFVGDVFGLDAPATFVGCPVIEGAVVYF